MHDALRIDAPQFARLDEWYGLWAIEPVRFARMLDVLRSTDLHRHAAAGVPARASTLEMIGGRNGKSIALLRATGTLMKQQPSMGGTSTIQLRRDLRQAASDPNVSGILLAIDSPGGTVSGIGDLAADVKSARKQKPVWSHIDDLGASAAYWLASQSDAVFANSPTALVGSIGTVMTIYDTSAMAEKEGVKPLVFATGPLKAAGAPGTVVTEEQASYFSKMVSDTQASFDDAVKRGRGLSATQLATVRSGAVYLAPEAQSLKLLDGIRPLDVTLAELAKAK